MLSGIGRDADSESAGIASPAFVVSGIVPDQKPKFMSSGGSSTSFTEIFTDASVSDKDKISVAATSFLVVGLASPTLPGIIASLTTSRA